MKDFTNEELAYLAGMVDADGSIMLYLRKGITLRLRLQVTNTAESIMDWLQERFGGPVSRGKRLNPLHKVGLVWFLDGDTAYDLIEQIQPYLVIKAAQAKLGRRAWEERTPTPLINRRKPLNPIVIASREEHVAHMRTLNAKGIPA